MYHRLRNWIEGHICICFYSYGLQQEIERLLKTVRSAQVINKARELVKTMYARTYTMPGHTKPSKVMRRMDSEQQELYQLVEDWETRDLGNA